VLRNFRKALAVAITGNPRGKQKLGAISSVYDLCLSGKPMELVEG